MNYEGEIRDINLVERLIQLWRDRFTGAIRFENDGIIKIIYFKGGDILSASTNDRADSVDEILMRAGKVSKEHVKQALAKRKESETLGDALLNLGFITRKELSWARRVQVINVVRSIESWQAGSFTVVADYLPKREEGTIFPLPQLIVEMVVTDQDRGRFERLLESGAAVFQKTSGHEEVFRKLGLNEDAEAVMAQVDGERQASEVAAASRQETFNAFKLLHALSLLGILERKKDVAAAAAVPGFDFENAGVADAADVWGTDRGAAQFTLADEPAGAFSMSDDMAPLPGLADPAADSMGFDAAPPLPPPPPPPTPEWAEPEPVASAAPEAPSWGFDEAQVEASKKAIEIPPAPVIPPIPPPAERVRPRPATPVAATDGTMTRRGKTAAPPAPVARSPRYGLLVALMAIFILGAAAFFGFTWWKGRQADAPLNASQPAPPPRRPLETSTPAATKTAPPVVETTATAAPVPVAKAPAAKAPAKAATGDRARYETMARDYAANPAGSFTVQFAIVCEPSNVTKALRSSGGPDVWFTPITLKERSCFRMFWGRFGNRQEAETAMGRLPGELRESRPAVVSVPR